jgi:hypothetical protein
MSQTSGDGVPALIATCNPELCTLLPPDTDPSELMHDESGPRIFPFDWAFQVSFSFGDEAGFEKVCVERKGGGARVCWCACEVYHYIPR